MVGQDGETGFLPQKISPLTGRGAGAAVAHNRHDPAVGQGQAHLWDAPQETVGRNDMNLDARTLEIAQSHRLRMPFAAPVQVDRPPEIIQRRNGRMPDPDMADNQDQPSAFFGELPEFVRVGEDDLQAFPSQNVGRRLVDETQAEGIIMPVGQPQLFQPAAAGETPFEIGSGGPEGAAGESAGPDPPALP